ncbi:Sugar kinase of the NBD/HSP70 family, may contain an N-terminal HTH domain [Roseivivax halotolerans]|jgi:predicted NBD/HSP70 family sugar kinase|uniref:Sugar kinase of the NBD/HSP70 family, may contain an N-terminal HTH domain n=2 Tax=Roseivivax halotolerans TaxID=93684 RepID=A0A1I5YQK1_9RHOB|nr:Sugar kinase of the NBD/HSP70 family, may contain an N-terminal HTH domain [Roseivivax halotolerans]
MADEQTAYIRDVKKFGAPSALDAGGDSLMAEGCGPLLRGDNGEAKPLRQQVFEHVRARGRATRAETARDVGISAGSVTQISADLIARGLLEEVEETDRAAVRGRPPIALSVVGSSGCVLGVKLSDQIHSAMISDFAGAELGALTSEARAGRRPMAERVDEVAALVERTLTQVGLDLSALSALAVGLPGLVDHDRGHVLWSPLMRETDIDLKAALEARLGLPVHLDNDVNMLGLAELWFGAGRAKSDFAVVTIEQGVGMGMVLGNRPFRGSRGMGLELGHTKVQLDGALCRCGKRGCLEAYVADYALAREAAIALDHGPETIAAPHRAIEALFQEARAGNRAARTIFSRAGRYLSLGLSNVVQLFDPELIILSGARMRYDYLYADEVLAEVAALSLNEGRTPARIEIHAWGDLVWARGATALALSAETDRILGGAA